MAHLCIDCDRSFLEERLLAGHVTAVHPADKADVAPAEGSPAEEATESPATEAAEAHPFTGGTGISYAVCKICGAGPYHPVHNARMRDASKRLRKKVADVASLDEFLAVLQDEAVQVRPGAAIAGSTGDSNDIAPAYLRSIYAVDTAPERRRVVKVTGDPGSYQTQVVNDYNTLNAIAGEIRQMSDVLAGVKQVGKPADLADSDDSPEEQAYLMQAWQAMAMYLSTCDDDDKAGAMQALKTISNLMSDNDDPNQPQPTGSFGVTSMARLDKAANTFDCPQCKRNFSTEAGLISHLKTIHAQREKQTKATTESD